MFLATFLQRGQRDAHAMLIKPVVAVAVVELTRLTRPILLINPLTLGLAPVIKIRQIGRDA
jgi:hypothetical protein